VLSLPVNAGTFKRSFLGGDGQLELHSDGDVWKDLFENKGKFKADAAKVDQIADLKVGVGASRDVTLGKSGGLSLTFGGDFEAHNQIQLLWPRAKALDKLGLTLKEGELYVRLLMAAKGNASAAGHFEAPAGVKVSFGLKAGGHASYELLKRFDAADSVKDILTGVFARVHLPQQIDKTSEIPLPGEVVIVRFGGYLDMSAGITWGYSLSGVKDLDVPRLELAADYALRVAATVNVGYKLAGDFELQASSGTDDGWVRFVVRKSRDSEFSFAADLGANVAAKLRGLPAGKKAADRFIAQLLGSDAEAVLKALDQARTLSTMEALQNEVNRLARTAVDKLAMVWVRKALSQENVKEFFELVGKAVDEYEKVDARIIQLYDEALNRIPQLKKTLDTLSALTPDGLKKALNDSSAANSPIVDFVTRTWGDDVFDLLLEGAAFARFQAFVSEARAFLDDGAHDRIKTLIETVKAELQLDDLVAKLKVVSNPEKLADEKLKGLFEQLVGKGFDQIKKSELPKALKQAHDTLVKIETFKNEWYARITDAADQNFNVSLGIAFAKATHDDALVDVEINLQDPAGPALADAASRGRFAELLERYASSAVKVRQGVLTRELKTTTHTHINVMGWGFDRVVTMVQKPEHSIEAQPGGLMHVFATETSVEQVRKSGRKYKERVASRFVLHTLGASLQAEKDPAPAIDPRTRQFLIQTLNKMAVEYDLSYDDERTKADELTYYLQFANRLGLLPSVAVDGQSTPSQMVAALNRQFGGRLGHVTVKYVVRYDDQAVRAAFFVEEPELSETARTAYRQFVSARNLSKAKNQPFHAAMAFAVLRQDLADESNRGSLANRTFNYEQPAWFTGAARRQMLIPREALPQLDLFFRNERALIGTLGNLDDLIDTLEKNRTSPAPRPIPTEALDRATRDFVGLADDTDHFGDGGFFAIVDALILAGSSGKATRRSAMVLEIRPEGAKEVVRKVLTAG
jgi:hypothetical protein